MEIPFTLQSLWRISKHADLSGLGGEISSGRWHTKGRPVVYFAESPAGALLESVVHLEFSRHRLPQSFTLLKIEAPQDVVMLEVEIPAAGWKQNVETTRSLGDAWLSDGKTLLARVPSVVVPFTWNILLNPRHRDADRVRIVSVIEEQFDARLFQFDSR